MKIALVYDRVNKWGGAERVLLAFHKIWPEAPLYTAVYDERNAQWADVFHIHSSFLQYIPFAKNFHELLPLLTPLAFESFNFDDFDIVISITSAEAKNIITKPTTIHICYCLTPTRYLWSGSDYYEKNPGLGIFSGIGKAVYKKAKHFLQSVDTIASSRPDEYIAISDRVKKRIETYYGRKVYDVVHPPVGIISNSGHRSPRQKHIATRHFGLDIPANFFLTVSRLVPYKRIDILIAAFNTLGLPLVIVGDGRQKQELKKMAQKNIHFVDSYLTDIELASYYSACRAFVYAADEDFGIAPVEAMQFGKPVIFYKDSGVRESVAEGVSGIFWEPQTSQALIDALRRFEQMKFNIAIIKARADEFREEVFAKRMKETVEKIYTHWRE